MHLRAISFDDLHDLFEWRNDDSIREWCRQVGYISWMDHLKWYKRQNNDPSIRMFLIEDGYNVGVCGLTSINHIHSRAEFSLYIAPKYQGKGYGKQALAKLFDFGFKELNLNLIWGETLFDNPAHLMFEKMGMKKEGTRRQFYFKDGKYISADLYSITREEWYANSNMDDPYSKRIKCYRRLCSDDKRKETKNTTSKNK